VGVAARPGALSPAFQIRVVARRTRRPLRRRSPGFLKGGRERPRRSLKWIEVFALGARAMTKPLVSTRHGPGNSHCTPTRCFFWGSETRCRRGTVGPDRELHEPFSSRSEKPKMLLHGARAEGYDGDGRLAGDHLPERLVWSDVIMPFSK
jgi:hypothetical protein